MRMTPVRLKLAFSAVAISLIATSAMAANTKDLVRICDSGRLMATERKDCKAQFKAAPDDAARLAVFRAFDAKISGGK